MVFPKLLFLNLSFNFFFLVWVKLQGDENPAKIYIDENDDVADLRKKVKAKYPSKLKDIDSTALNFEYPETNFSKASAKIKQLLPNGNTEDTPIKIISKNFIQNFFNLFFS